MILRIALVLALLLPAACGGSGTEGPADASPDGFPSDGAADGWIAGDMPEWEAGRLDDGYELEGLSRFYLVGNALTPGQDELDVTVRAPASVARLDAWIDETYQGRLAGGEGAFQLTADLAGLAPGEHAVVLAADMGERAVAAPTFIRTHPLYVVVTNDWDDPDNHRVTFENQEALHEGHPALRLTHFLGPYTFTDSMVTEARRAEIVAWLRGMVEGHDDEVGLHIHPYCSFIEAAGLECMTEPSFAYGTPDRSGYTVFLGLYDEEQTVTLAETAAELFVAYGLEAPTSFRAGGWTAEIQNLRGLARAGLVADSSAMNWERLEEWQDDAVAQLYPWCREQWSTITETSQPYHPNEEDILSSAPPVVPILEVPDNGLLVDYVTAEEMIEMFGQNWNGGALEEPRQYSIGYHPPNFGDEFFGRIDDALDHIDQFLAESGEGPVVYATLSELPLVWPLGQ